MRLFIGLAILAFTVGNVSARAQDKGDAQAGKAVYGAKCEMCHGAGGEGNPVMAKTLKVKFEHLGSEVQDKSDDNLKKIITQGKKKMPPIAGLSDKQVQDVIAFVRTLTSKGGEEEEAEEHSKSRN